MERKKVTPDKWQFNYNVTKERAGTAPEGRAFLWERNIIEILANQNVKKLDANNYTTSLIGLKKQWDINEQIGIIRNRLIMHRRKD